MNCKLYLVNFNVSDTINKKLTSPDTGMIFIISGCL